MNIYPVTVEHESHLAEEIARSRALLAELTRELSRQLSAERAELDAQVGAVVVDGNAEQGGGAAAR